MHCGGMRLINTKKIYILQLESQTADEIVNRLTFNTYATVLDKLPTELQVGLTRIIMNEPDKRSTPNKKFEDNTGK